MENEVIGFDAIKYFYLFDLYFGELMTQLKNPVIWNMDLICGEHFCKMYISSKVNNSTFQLVL